MKIGSGKGNEQEYIYIYRQPDTHTREAMEVKWESI